MAEELKQLADQFLQLQQRCWELALSPASLPDDAPENGSTRSSNEYQPNEISRTLFDAHARLLQTLSNSDKTLSPETLADHFQNITSPALSRLLLEQWQLPASLATAITKEQPGSENPSQDKAPPDPLATLIRGTASFAPACNRFNQALARYLTHLEAINQHTLHNLEQALKESGQPGSGLELESLWTDCYEEAYRQQVFKPAYQKDYAELCNSCTEMKESFNSQLETSLSGLGMVSSATFRQNLIRQQQQKKAMRRMQQKIRTLQEQLDTMSRSHQHQLAEFDSERSILRNELKALRELVLDRGTK
ncbi:poly(R)-hydroxyalkanoic acid synthase subunit PhaE [Marinobacterium jannaschii]|uniref:poly(R)-hydroxyalkanoic acid synthase subunit PhaE n=1 Tax=Marinobacterium jannaschii TaxID=64970 RepID=UPI000486F554|nr:poly(R)-hydroxyalkanoic acid synthase subunit PhaE [Marinobacterium jannaschii]